MSQTETTPEQDRDNIVDQIAVDISEKYARGQAEHKTKLWTGGMRFFAEAAREEVIDSVAYTHHLIEGIAAIEQMALRGINNPAEAALCCAEILHRIEAKPERHS